MKTATETVPLPQAETQHTPWTTILWFGGLIVLCYATVLRPLIEVWSTNEDMGHGFFVPVIAGYIAWQSRDRLLSRELRPNYWGLAVVFWGAIQLYLATLGAEIFLSRVAIIVTIVGVVLTLGGWYALRVLAFPLSLLVFMVPIPAIIYGALTLPLQLFASRVAEVSLSLMGIPVLREGNVLELASQRLSVVEACSGIRSLLTLTFLSLVYAYFFDKRPWMRPVLLVATIPIAIVANASRVTLTGIMSEIDPSLAEGFFHSASGWVIFMVALFILVTVHQVFDRVSRMIARRSHAPLPS